MLIALQQAGSVKHASWVLTFQCNKMVKVENLQHLAKSMEKELQEWEDDVKRVRADFYELNYYTTFQLLSLQKELGKLKEQDGEISPQILALMQSISTEVSAHNVRDVVFKMTPGQKSLPHSPRLSLTNLLKNGLAFLMILLFIIIASIFVAMGFTRLAFVLLIGEVMALYHSYTSKHGTNVLSKDSVRKKYKAEPATVTKPEDHLSKHQEAIYTELTELYGYQKKLVVMALQHCGEDVYEIQKWCMDNAHKYQFPDDESEIDDDEPEVEETPYDSEPQFCTESSAVPESTKGTLIENTSELFLCSQLMIL